MNKKIYGASLSDEPTMFSFFSDAKTESTHFDDYRDMYKSVLNDELYKGDYLILHPCELKKFLEHEYGKEGMFTTQHCYGIVMSHGIHIKHHDMDTDFSNFSEDDDTVMYIKLAHDEVFDFDGVTDDARKYVARILLDIFEENEE